MSTGILYSGNAVTTITYTPQTDAKIRITGGVPANQAVPLALCYLNGIYALMSDAYATQGSVRGTTSAEYWLAAGVTYTLLTTANHVIISTLES